MRILKKNIYPYIKLRIKALGSNVMTLVRLILLPGLLITSSIINGEAIPPGSEGYFSVTMCEPVKAAPLSYPFLPKPLSAANDAYDALQKEVDDVKSRLCRYEAKSETDNPEYYRLWARLSEIYVETNPSSAGYHSQNKLYYLWLAKKAEQRTLQDQQEKAWDEEEQAYAYDSAEWHEFKARVAGVMAEWYESDTQEYSFYKKNQSIYTQNAKFLRQQKELEQKYVAWKLEAKSYVEGTSEWYEFLAWTEGEQAMWYASSTPEYARHKDNQQRYIQQAVDTKRKEEEAEQQRQQRISVGRAQLQDPNYELILLIINSVFEHATLLDISPTLTPDDRSEIMFYIPQELKDEVYGISRYGFFVRFNANAASRIQARDWSAFSEIHVDFQLLETRPYAGELQPTQHILASPEIEQFIECKLRKALKSLVDGTFDYLIDQNWGTIYKNFSPDDLNRVRRDLTANGISAATLDLSGDFFEDGDLQTNLQNGAWVAVLQLVMDLKFIDLAAIQQEWNKLYNLQLDLDPKRPFASAASYTDREVNAITVIARELDLASSKELLIKAAEVIFSKERAEAIVNKYLNPFEDTDEDE